MPLSEHEQRILAEIERRLLEEDPKFAHQVGSSFRMHLARRLRLASLGFVVGLVVLVAGSTRNVWLGVAGFLIMLLSILEVIRTLRRRAAVDQQPTGERPAGSPPSPPRRQQRGAGLESWWGRMTERWRSHWDERGRGAGGAP